MSRVRMNWDWVGDYPIFVYTTFKDHFIFDVKIVKGKKGDQNAPGFGPSAKAWHSYTQRGVASTRDVATLAFDKAAELLVAEGHVLVTNIHHDEYITICNHCGKQGGGHFDSCTPYYPENPDLSDEERAKHGLPSNAEVFEGVENDCVNIEESNGIKMIDVHDRPGAHEPLASTPPWEDDGKSKCVGEPGPFSVQSGRKKERLEIEEYAARTCPICRKRCKSEQGKADHMRKVHPSTGINPEFNF